MMVEWNVVVYVQYFKTDNEHHLSGK